MTPTTKNRFRAVALASVMVLSVMAVSIAFADTAAASSHSVHHVENFGLEATSDGTASWTSPGATLSVTNSTGGLGDEARVVLQAEQIGVTTLADLNQLSWQVTGGTGYAPHVDVILDRDGNGEADGSLVFEHANADECGVNDLPQGDYQTFSDVTVITNATHAWLSTDATDPGPCEDATGAVEGFSFVYGSLGEWKNGVPDDAEIDENVDSSTAVLRVEIEVDNWIEDPSSATVSGILVNNEPYYGRIQDAENGAVDGDSIVVGDGTYEEDVVVDTEVSLQAGSSPDLIGSFTLEDDDVSVVGFEITGAEDAAIVTDPDFSGYLIEDNYIHGNNLGVKFRTSGESLSIVRGNTFEDNDLQTTDSVSKAINTGFSDSGAGLHNALIESNEFTGHTEGANSYSIQLIASDGGHSDVDIVGNSMESTILANDVTDLSVAENTVDFANDGDSTSALLLGGGVVGASVNNNTLVNAGRGLGVLGFFGPTNEDVTAVGNNFQNNAIQVETDGGLDIESTLDQNTFDRAVVVDRPSSSLLNTIWSSIQDAEDAAADGDTIEVSSGDYEESVVVDTPNVAITGETDVSIDGRFELVAEGTSLDNLMIGGITTNTPSVDNEAVFVSASHVTLSNLEIDGVRGSGSAEVEAVHIYSGPQISGIDIVGLDVDNITSETAGANGVKIQRNVTEVRVSDSSFDNIHGAWSYGVTVTASQDGPETPAGVEIEKNTFGSITASEYWGVGIGIETWNGVPGASPGTDARQVTVKFNDFNVSEMDAGILNKDLDHSLDATLNWWESDRGPSTGSMAPSFSDWIAGGVVGEVTYDPFLTAPQDQVDHEDTQQFAHDLNVAVGVGSIGVPGATETTVLEIFDENQNGELDDLGESAIYAFDASSDSWELADPSASLDALDALVVVSDDGGRAVVDLADSPSPMPPGEGDAFEGWNLMSAPFYGTADAAFGAGSANAERIVHLYEQPSSQPYGDGADPIRTFDIGSGEGFDTEAYGGYWVYVDEDGTIAGVVPAGVSASDEAELIGGV